MTKYRKKNPRSRPRRSTGKRSRLEEILERELKRHKGKHSVRYECDRLPYVLTKFYVPDWTVTRPDGTVFFIEAKGWFRPEDRSKMLAVKMANPHLDIRFVFPKDNKLNKNSSTTYSEWCIRHGFPYAIGNVPKEWFNGR